MGASSDPTASKPLVRHMFDTHNQPRMAKKLNLQESRVVICCLYSLTACRPVEF
jgi:hypothetical protein